MTRHTLLLLALLPLLGACNPCAERCRLEARELDPCLQEWGLEWADLGADDLQQFRETCIDEQTLWLNSLEGDERREAIDGCMELNQSLRGSSSCEETEAALQGWREL